VKNEMQREILVRQAAQRLGMEVSQVLRASAQPQRAKPAPPATRPSPPAERMLIETMAISREVAELVAERDALALFEDPTLADAGHRIVAAWKDDEPIGDALTELPEALASRLMQVVVQGSIGGEPDCMQVATDCLRRVKETAARRRRAVLEVELRQGDMLADEAGREKLAHLDQLLREDRRREQ